MYELACHSCGRTVTLPPCGDACPRCGAALNIEWDSPRLEAEAARLRERTEATEVQNAAMRKRLAALEAEETLRALKSPEWRM